MASDLFAILRRDHQEVQKIFQEIIGTDDASEREDLLDNLVDQIIPHLEAEEKVVYPSLLEAEEEKVHELALEALEEHHAAKLVLRELQNLSAEEERFKARATVLHEMVEHHIHEEEGKIFEVLETYDERKITRLAERFTKEKDRIKKSLI